MISPSNELQRKRHSPGQGFVPSCGGCGRAVSSAAHDKRQNGSHPRPVVERRHSSRRLTLFLPVRTGLGFGRGLFSQFIIAIHSGWHRQAIARTRWPAVQILRSPCGCALSFQKHASCQGMNAFEGHQRLSSSVGFDANRHSERRFADEKIQLPREQNE